MARPRESDRRNYPEQLERLLRAMKWAGVASAAELSERMDGAITGPTLNNRIQGNHRLKPVEVEPIARALGVSPAVLEPSGPMLPDPSEAYAHLILTGSPGAWTATLVVRGRPPQEIVFTTDDPPALEDLLPPTEDAEQVGDRVPAPRTKLKAKEASS